jgi:6-phosphofructokinase
VIRNLGHAGTHRRVALNVGSAFVPGLNSVLMGTALAGGKLGWEIVGIRDGFEGLLHPERYPDGELMALSPEQRRAGSHGQLEGGRALDRPSAPHRRGVNTQFVKK